MAFEDFGPDGTQAPPPPPAWPDPLAGLVTAESFTWKYGPRIVVPPKPVLPPAEAMREAILAAMAEERRPAPKRRRATPPPRPRQAPGAQPQQAVPAKKSGASTIGCLIIFIFFALVAFNLIGQLFR